MCSYCRVVKNRENPGFLKIETPIFFNVALQHYHYVTVNMFYSTSSVQTMHLLLVPPVNHIPFLCAADLQFE